MSRALGIVICSRCGRRVPRTAADAGGWNVNFRHGVIVGYVCPHDQTALDHAEATVNEATGASQVAREVGPGDPDWWDAVAQHLDALANDVWTDFLNDVITSGVAAQLNPYELADRTLDRLAETIGVPTNRSPLRDHLAQGFRDRTRGQVAG